jgi:hypothetical protein
MEVIFGTTEEGVPWRVRQETEYSGGGVSFENWIGLWQKYINLDIKAAFKSLVYVGYCGKMKDAVTLYRYRLYDSLKQSKHKVFHAYVVGLNNKVNLALYNLT